MCSVVSSHAHRTIKWYLIVINGRANDEITMHHNKDTFYGIMGVASCELRVGVFRVLQPSAVDGLTRTLFGTKVQVQVQLPSVTCRPIAGNNMSCFNNS